MTLPAFRIGFALALSLSLGLSCTARAQDAATRGPQPELEPVQVVEAMLLALKKDSEQGIAELYRFSSPGNREQTGSLSQFSDMIREGFPDLLGHHAARAAPPLIDGDRAIVPVEVIGSDEALHRYVFVLSRQRLPECAGCWMADAVAPPEAFGAPEEEMEDGGPDAGGLGA